MAEADSMVERVARAICEKLFDDFSGQENYWIERSRTAARAAIAAMREPTEEMLEYAREEVVTDSAFKEAIVAWRVMIDAALGTEQEQNPQV